MRPILIIKFGTASITQINGEIDESIIDSIAKQVAEIQSKFNIILVSSGAVGAGKKFIKGFKGELSQRKAAAAIGNPILMGLYAKAFQKYKISVAQSLCERRHFAHRIQFLQLKETYEMLWNSGSIPIANENDVVSDLELKFSDNDELATLLAAGFGASLLLFSTSTGGLLDKSGKIIPVVESIDQSIWNMVDNSKSALGLGGMLSKLSFAKRANQLGIRATIFGIHVKNSILLALEGKTGTVFNPMEVVRSSKQKWLSTGSLISGKIVVDDGAADALISRKSLLAVGILSFEGEFEPGETVDIYNTQNLSIASAQVKISSRSLAINLKKQNFEVANADYIVIH